MTKIVWLAIVLMLLAVMTIITTAYACEGEGCEGHPEGECSHHAKCEGHTEEECSNHAEGECSGHGEEHAKGECHGVVGMMKNLSSEQRIAVHAKIKAMRAEGATHEQIRAATEKMLKEVAESKIQTQEAKPAVSPDIQKGNSNERSWLAKTVSGVGYAFKAVTRAIAGIFS